MNTDLTPEQRVANGASLFDAKVPGWERNINLETMDLTHYLLEQGGCMVCQATQCDYTDGLMRLGFIPGSDDAWEHGFESHAAWGEFDELMEAWSSLVKSRFDSGALSA